jgi:DNA-binding NarL/FixJ family response regulator
MGAEKLQSAPRKGVANRIPRSFPLWHDGSMTPPSILIVDDHPSFRATARALLQAEGFDVIGEAVDGASALEAVRELKPEVVLLDVQLPDTDGFAIVAELTRTNGAPLVVLTSSRDRSDFGPLVSESGARGFVAKAELSGPALTAILQ